MSECRRHVSARMLFSICMFVCLLPGWLAALLLLLRLLLLLLLL